MPLGRSQIIFRRLTMFFSSSEVCNIANVSKKTLRHYDKIDLLKPIISDDNGYWFYTEEDLNKLQVIKNLQLIGFSLSEIKNNLVSDCTQLRISLPEKMNFINEQIIQLEMAKRLLKKIQIKTDLSPLEAINESLDEEHLDWYKKNLQPDQFKLVEDMMRDPESMDTHDKLIQLLLDTKPHIKSGKQKDILAILEQIYKLFTKYQLSHETITLLLESFLKSILEGPLSKRLLTLKEVVYLLDLIDINP